MYHPFLKELMMKSLFAALAFSLPVLATAQVYSGPCPDGCIPAAPVEPVSYTHLDVYKRQVTDFLKIPTELHGAGGAFGGDIGALPFG